MRGGLAVARTRDLSRTRLLRRVTTMAGLVLLTVAVASSIGAASSAARDDLDHALTGQAAAGVSALTEYFDRAESVNLLFANDTALRQFAPESRAAAGTAAALSVNANHALEYLENLYPDAISEACLIDASGVELARVVRGVVAPEEELSTEEAEAPFFAPTMRLPKGRVHQAAPYLSPDTDEWVVSNSTPMVTDAGETWGLVHFEVTLNSFRDAALSGADAELDSRHRGPPRRSGDPGGWTGVGGGAPRSPCLAGAGSAGGSWC